MRLHSKGRDRHGTQDLERDAAHVALVSAVEHLHLAGDQPGRRAGVLRVRVPGSTGQLGGHEEVALGPEEGVGHRRIVWVAGPA